LNFSILSLSDSKNLSYLPDLAEDRSTNFSSPGFGGFLFAARQRAQRPEARFRAASVLSFFEADAQRNSASIWPTVFLFFAMSN
jgi:hypothetical protein